MRNPRRVFGMLEKAALRAPAGRLAISVLAAVGIGMLTVSASAPPHVRITTTPVASGGWLDRLNSWRNSTRVPTLTENATWSSGDYNHSLYMVKNDLVTHYETVGVPYYTLAGDTAARNGNIQVSSTTSTTDETAIDWWMAAPFHALGLMDPRLSQTGFGSYRENKPGWDAGFTVDTLRGNPFSGGSYPVYFPGNGASEPLTSYGGGEFPNPLQGPCAGYSVPTGLPVFVQVGGNVATTAGALHSITGNGVPLEHCVLDSNSAGVGSNLTGRGAVILIPRQPLQTGVTYVVAVTVNGVAHTWSFTVGPFVPPVYCTGVSGTLAPPTQAVAGTPVLFTASATGCPNPRFRFWVAPPAGPWGIAQDYSPSATFNWTTTGIPGAYRLEVDVKDLSSAATYDKVANYTYTITGTATTCTAATLSPSQASPQAPGTQVTWTATATGCPNPRYRFWEFDPGSRWSMVRDYSAANTFTWNSPSISGPYQFEVDVRDVSETSTYDVVANKTYNLLSPGVCANAALSTTPSTSGATGVTVTLTGSSATCPNPRYRFWILDPGRNWSMVQDYSAATTYTWTQTGLAGSYSLEVDVRDATSPAVYESVANKTYNLLSSGVCANAALSTTPSTPGATGVTVTLTGSSATCPNPRYRFWILDPGRNWSMVQDYSAATTYTWTQTGLAGSYSLEVDVRDATSPAVYESVSNITYVVSACSAAGLTANPPNTAAQGTPITLTATSICLGTPNYKFWIQAPNGNWTVVQNYGTANTFTWTPATAGIYHLEVDVRNQGGTDTYEKVANLTYSVT